MEAKMFKSFWIQCNKCGVPYNNPNGIRLCCTSCSHLLCEKCFRHPCPICQKNFEKVPIGPNMPSQIRLYFEEMPKLLNLLQKIGKFQSEQVNAVLARKWTVFDKIQKAKQVKMNLMKNNALVREKLKANLKRVADLKDFIYDCERRKARRMEQERISSQYMTHAPIRQPGTFFNQSGSARSNIHANVTTSARRLTEFPHMSGFANRSFSRTADSGHISDYSPGIRTPVQGRPGTPSGSGIQPNRSGAAQFVNDWRKRNFTPYGSKAQFTTPQRSFGPPKDPRYRLE